MKLENMPSEISQSQKDKYCMSPFIRDPRVVKFIERKSRIVVSRGWWKKGYRVIV